MHFHLAITVKSGAEKGFTVPMSKFTDEESVRLRNVLARKRIADEKEVQRGRIVAARGGSFWQETRVAIRKAMNELNQNVGEDLFFWREENIRDFEIIASSVGPKCVLDAAFD